METSPHLESRNPLAPVLLARIRLHRMEREAHDATRFVMREAVSMLRDQYLALERERANRLAVVNELRALRQRVAQERAA